MGEDRARASSETNTKRPKGRRPPRWLAALAMLAVGGAGCGEGAAVPESAAPSATTTTEPTATTTTAEASASATTATSATATSGTTTTSATPTSTPEPDGAAATPVDHGGPYATLEEALAPTAPDSVTVYGTRRLEGTQYVLYARPLRPIAARAETLLAPLGGDASLLDELVGAASNVVADADVEQAIADLTPEARAVLATPAAEALWVSTLSTIDACERTDDYGRWSCCVARGADAEDVLAGFDPTLARFAVARIEGRAGSLVRTGERELFAAATLVDDRAHLVPSDDDGDGERELVATLELALPRSDAGMNGTTTARVVTVLGPDLDVQLALTTLFTEEVFDVGGTRTTCPLALRYEDTNGDGHADAHLTGRCTSTEESDLDDRRHVTRTEVDRVCPYDASADRWTCPSGAPDALGGVGESVVSATGPRRALPARDELATRVHALLRAAPTAARSEAPPAATDAPSAAPTAATDAPSEAPAPTEPPGAATSPASTAATSPTTTAAPCPFVVADPAPPLRVRAEPSARSEVRGELANGTELALGERRGRFARIEAPVAGWVWTESLVSRCR